MDPQTAIDAFFNVVESYLNKNEAARVRHAFEVARREHGDQQRKSGEPFYLHPLTVASYLAEFHLDADALAAALLHDAAEDTKLSLEAIEADFGPTVARLVDGVTKLKDVSKSVAQGESLTADEIRHASLHKLFEAMTADVRVVIIKLFDRLHNMRTIKALPADKQRQKAEESIAVYGPLANRLGIWRLKNELEALSLEILHQRAHDVIKQRLDRLRLDQQPLLAQVSDQIVKTLAPENVKVRAVLPCPENVFTTFQALQKAQLPFSEVDRTLRVAILLEDEPSCYLSLGYIHRLWRPVPNRFDDYIALPRRDNLYRALHTTVIHSSGQPVKIRFRTVAMNEESEIGVLARWVYADTPLWSRGLSQRVEALFASIHEDINLEPDRPGAAAKGVVEDIFRNQIVVYTPRGDIVELPQGATPIDFAYTIHTEVGHHARAARVNEHTYALNRPLNDGDRVQIITSDKAAPQRTWLDEDLGFMTTSRARAKARRWFRRLSRKDAIRQGQKLLEDELAMLGLPAGDPPETIAALFNFHTADELYYALGRAELLATAVASRVLANDWHREGLQEVGSRVWAADGEQYVVTHTGGRRLKLCQTCHPEPGNPIIGFLRSDGGITVHKESCHALPADPLSERTLKLGWSEAGSYQVRLVPIRIDVYDRSGLLFEIAKLFHEEDINIKSINTPDGNGRDGTVTLFIELEAAGPGQLVRILHRIHALVNVFSVRVLPGRGRQREARVKA